MDWPCEKLFFPRIYKKVKILAYLCRQIFKRKRMDKIIGNWLMDVAKWRLKFKKMGIAVVLLSLIMAFGIVSVIYFKFAKQSEKDYQWVAPVLVGGRYLTARNLTINAST